MEDWPAQTPLSKVGNSLSRRGYIAGIGTQHSTMTSRPLHCLRMDLLIELSGCFSPFPSLPPLILMQQVIVSTMPTDRKV